VGGRYRWTCLAQPGDEEQAIPRHTEFEELHGDSFWEVLGEEQTRNQLNVVICYTSKCMPCKLAKPIMAEWEEDLVQGQGKQVKMFQFALTMPNKDCALAMDVRSSPTFLVIRDGEIVSRGKGKAALDDIKEFVYANA
jgi:thiol-disulfide isomerase/thioredoxin